jgi:septation ring formation regulator EzrA
MGEKMNKTIKLVGTGFIGVVCSIYITFSIIHMTRVNSKMDEWNESYKAIEEDVSAFIKVSDPKTIRLYVKELNKMLDDMNRLGILIDGGNELNIILTDYEKEYIRLQKKVSEVLDEVEVVKDKLITQNITLSEDQDELFDTTEDLEIIIKDQSDYINQLNTTLSQKIKDVEKDVIIIKDSKYGKKIWEIKK